MQFEPLPLPITSPLISTVETGKLKHGFFTRHGGVSEGIYRGLNVGLGSHDNREAVEENRRRVAEWFGASADHLATVHQVHSPDVVVVTGENYTDRPKADAMVTKQPGIVLGVLAADCGPVLFADAQAGVIGAAHAGWKGAVGGILENTIDAMIALGADRDNIVACLGPSISQDNYEVGPERVAELLALDPNYQAFLKPSNKEDHALFDLQSLTLSRLEKAGVAAQNLGICTYPDADRFFSFRRTNHLSEPDYGRQISAIALTETR
jgi:YfiH family protein